MHIKAVACLLLLCSFTGMFPVILSYAQETVLTEDTLGEHGYSILEDQVFDIRFGHINAVRFISAVNEASGELWLFFADESGNIVYRTNHLDCNLWDKRGIGKPELTIFACAFRDANGNGLTDIILITQTVLPEQQISFKTGDILFQYEKGFYRDWRITHDINRLTLNVDIDMILAHVRDGLSTEFLYTAKSLKELTAKGFVIIEPSYAIDFGLPEPAKAVFGAYAIGRHQVFMGYIVQADGQILWNFQPMEGYDNFSSFQGVFIGDMDGDATQDLLMHIRFNNWETVDGIASSVLVDDFYIYYQKDGEFVKDQEFKAYYRAQGKPMETRLILEDALLYWRGERLE